MLARFFVAVLALAAFVLLSRTHAASLAGSTARDRISVVRSGEIGDSSFNALVAFIDAVKASASSSSSKPEWTEVTKQGLALSSRQHGGRPETLRFCEPELKVCNTGVVWTTSNGTKMFLRQAEDLAGKALEREVCEINSFGDVRVCIDWDTNRKYRDMKDLKGHWYKVADQ